MHAAPAFQVVVRDFGIWRGTVVSIAALDLLTIAAFCVEQVSNPGNVLFGVVAMAALGITAALATAWVAVTLFRVSPSLLRWDGRVWRLSFADPVRGADDLADRVGSLTVAIDLGSWLLLRFAADGPGPGLIRWLPVQRFGLESHWHALRCAVFGARRRSLDEADDEPFKST